jgi:hypothetical protein
MKRQFHGIMELNLLNSLYLTESLNPASYFHRPNRNQWNWLIDNTPLFHAAFGEKGGANGAG